MSYERPYYTDLNYHPFLYYIVFGVKSEELQVSRERHHVEGFPKGLDFVFFSKKKNDSYMQSLLGGTLGEILDRKKHILYEKVKNTDKWAVIRGEVQQDADLGYMRDCIGFVQDILDLGAVVVLDLQTISLYSYEEWTECFFEKEFCAYDHVTILLSEMEGGLVWLHTRGMRKFGRPDVSIENVPENETEDAAQAINQMIYYGSIGTFFDRDMKLHTHSGRTYFAKPQFINDFENPDFNNSYYSFVWRENIK